MLKILTRKFREKTGFTLVELIVVIAVLAILAALAVPQFSGFVDKANKANDDQLVAIVEKAITLSIYDGTLVSGSGLTFNISKETDTTSAGALKFSDGNGKLVAPGEGASGNGFQTEMEKLVGNSDSKNRLKYYTSLSIQIDANASDFKQSKVTVKGNK